MLKQEKNVLLLIANRRVSTLTAKLLEAHGFKCVEASAFTQALTLVGNGGAQIALVDFGVEPDDGCRFAAEAKKLPGGIPVVVCDSEPSVARARQVRASAAFDYLCCPFVVPDLVSCLKRGMAVLTSMRRPFAALDAYLTANDETPESVRAPDAAAAAGSNTPSAAPDAAPSVPPSAPSDSTSPRASVGRDDLLRRERELLAALRANGILDEDVEGKAAEKLAREAQAPDGTLSALAALELVSEDAWERAAEWVAEDRKAPPVDFGAFPPDAKLARVADASVLRTLLAVPFAKLESVTLVALPNPDSAARTALEQAVGGECRFFTCSGLAAKAALERAFAPKGEEGATA